MTEATRPRFNRPLTQMERDLLLWLAVASVAAQMGCTEQDAADALDELTEHGETRIVGNETDVHLIVRGRSLIHAARDWLSFHASRPGWEE